MNLKTVFIPKEKHSPTRNIWWLCLCLLLVFTTFIATIVATAGSTSNYYPINDIYIGEADISHINVSKVIPQMGPILTVLGSALTAPNSSLDEIFHALNDISATPALTPLLLLLSNAQNVTGTIVSLVNLAPLALQNDSNSNSIQDLVKINDLLTLSTNKNSSLIGINHLVEPTLRNINNENVMTANAYTLQLLNNSNNPLTSTQGLMVLNNMTLAEKAALLPVFSLFQYSNNNTVLTTALQQIMNDSQSMSGSTSSSMFNTLETVLQQQLAAGTSNITQIFQGIEQLVTTNQRPIVQDVGMLLSDSNNVNSTLTILQNLIANNITTNEKAQEALPALINIVNESKNVTQSLSLVTSLATTANSTIAAEQLAGLDLILKNTEQQDETVTQLISLANGLTPESDTIESVPYLFQLIESSKNPAETFSSLVTITTWAQQNPDTFEPIVDILNAAHSVEPISEEHLTEMTPTLLQYLHIPIYFRLSIFTLCTADINNDIISCNSPHAVQDLDFRNIIYDALIESDFEPYLRGLDISADDLYLEGKLLDRQHEYVPSIKAILSMNILTIIFSAAVMAFIIFILIAGWRKVWSWFTVIILTLATALFSGISGTCVAIVIEVIKSGTYDDNYGVVYLEGPAYLGLIWSGFAFVFVSAFILMWAAWCYRKHVMLNKEIAVYDLENGKTSDANENGLANEDGLANVVVHDTSASNDMVIVPTVTTSNSDSINSNEKEIGQNDHIEDVELTNNTSTVSDESGNPIEEVNN